METTINVGGANYKDQGAWLKVFGVFQFIAAAFLGFTRLRSVLILHPIVADTMAIYGLVLGVGGIAKRVILGWGSIKARRWARAILLISSWFNLGVGLITVPFMYWMMNHFPINDSRVTPHFRTVMGLVVSAFTFVIAVLIPWVFIWFYSREDVKKTCEAKNPNPSWTDSCPLPVLGLALFLALGAMYVLLSALLPGYQFPILIWAVGGVSSKIIMFLWAAGSMYAAYLLYRLSIQGLRLAVALTGLGFVNGVVFYTAKGWDGFMSLLGQNISLQKDMQSMMLVIKPFIGMMMMGSVVGLSAYMIFVKKRYFSDASTS